jgi:hypothetical protein
MDPSDIHVTVAFVDTLGHSHMVRLLRQGPLWCRETPANRSNAQSLWKSVQPMRLTLAGAMPATRDGLEDVLDDILVHHPLITSLTLIGAGSMADVDDVLSARQFSPTDKPFSYRRVLAKPV